MGRINVFLHKWKNCDKKFLIHKDRFITYKQAISWVDDLNTFLKRNNLSKQNIAIFSGNSPEFVIAYWAIIFADSTNIPININLTDTEITSEINYCDCNCIISQSQYVDRLLKIPDLKEVAIVEISYAFKFNIVRHYTGFKSRENTSDIAVMLHTSGTTGNPKKVMLSHDNLLANTLSNIKSLALTENDVVLIALPLFFGYCHTAQFLTHTRIGGTIVLYDQLIFTSRCFCQLIENYRITCFTAVPTMLSIINQYKYLANYNLNSLRYLCFGGGSVSLEMLTHLIKILPNTGIVQTYGQTECSPRVTALLPQDSLRKLGSIGKCIPGVKILIIKEDGNIAKQDEIGEITVKGKNITKGYYKRAQEFNALIKDDWLCTGDLAYYDQEGYFYLVGRKKNIIISGGINIYPEEIESKIRQHEAVSEVVVKGELDTMLGEIPVAEVTLAAGKSLNIAELRQFLSKDIAQYKHPRKLFIRDHFDKTATGKIART